MTKPEPLKGKLLNKEQGFNWAVAPAVDIHSAVKNHIRWLNDYSHLTPRDLEIHINRLKYDFEDVMKE